MRAPYGEVDVRHAGGGDEVIERGDMRHVGALLVRRALADQVVKTPEARSDNCIIELQSIRGGRLTSHRVWLDQRLTNGSRRQRWRRRWRGSRIRQLNLDFKFTEGGRAGFLRLYLREGQRRATNDASGSAEKLEDRTLTD